jgi:hypothetical protein
MRASCQFTKQTNGPRHSGTAHDNRVQKIQFCA